MNASSSRLLSMSVLLLVGCGDIPKQASTQMLYGVVQIYLHDEPPDDPSITSVLVRFSSLDVRRKGGGWHQLDVPPTEIDLLQLTGGIDVMLAQHPLPAGEYDEIRLIVDSASLVTDGEEVPVEVPSGAQSGLKLKGTVDLRPGDLTQLSIDFDPGKSLVRKGNGEYSMKPVLSFDGSTVVEGGAIAREVTPEQGGVLELPSGARLDVPPGAVSETTVISMVVDVDSNVGGNLVGDRYLFSPHGLKFNAPVTVTLPYDDSAIPDWSDEAEVHVAWDWERVEASDLDMAQDLVSVKVTHFTGGQPEVEEEVSRPHPGVWLFEGGSGSDKYVVAVIDSWDQSLRIRGFEGKLAHGGNNQSPQDAAPWSDGSMHELTSIPEMAGDDAWVAMNTVAWDGPFDNLSSPPQEAFIYDNTACVEGRWRAFRPDGPENLLMVPKVPTSVEHIFIAPSENENQIPEWLKYTVFGSRTTFIWFDEWARSNGAYELVCGGSDIMPWRCWEATGDCALDTRRPRAAVGTDESNRYLFMFSSSGPSVGWCAISSGGGGFSVHDVYHILRRERTLQGPQTSLQASFAINLDGGHSPSLYSQGELKVKANTINTPDEGAHVIAGLGVFPKPTVTSITPETANLGELTEFTIMGKNLPMNTRGFITDCVGPTWTTGNTEVRKFSCTPSYTTGKKDGVVKDEPNGTVLEDEFELTVL